MEERGGGGGEAGGGRVEVDKELGVVKEAGAGGEGEELDELAERGRAAEVAAGDEACEGAAEGGGSGAGSKVAEEEVRRRRAGRRHGYDASGGKRKRDLRLL